MLWSSAHSSITSTCINTLIIAIFLHPFEVAGNKWSPAEVIGKNKGSSSASCSCLLFSFLCGACQLLVILAKHMIRVLERIQTANKQAHLGMNTHKLVDAQYVKLISRSCPASSHARQALLLFWMESRWGRIKGTDPQALHICTNSKN